MRPQSKVTDMSNDHIIKLEVILRMTEMDGTAEASAEIAMQLVYETLTEHLAGDVLEVSVPEYYDETDTYEEGE